MAACQAVKFEVPSVKVKSVKFEPKGGWVGRCDSALDNIF